MLIDAHNHLADPRFEDQREQIIAEMKKAGIIHCVVNGTHPDDWPTVAELAERHPDFITPSFGLHPWRVKDRTSDWLPLFKSYLTRFPRAGVGECGLDRWIAEPDFPAQLEVFQIQLALAAELDRPATIHCLKAWGPLLETLQAAPTLPRFLVHSYGGSLETARQLEKLEAHFSFSGYFLHEKKAAQLEIFRQLPQDRLLFETDAPDMLPPPSARSHSLGELNHPANLPLIAESFLKGSESTLPKHFPRTVAFFKIPDNSR